ncbi:RbsD/FucU domain-containing protein [Sphingobacterium siyangense]|uniref:RbsD/FucU domain-containing protein n=1 Tax=Sphingobacterium TaxID=28453 RepID=UPI00257998FC|nr:MULTISPECIES: RbsD/FucU domain-containing protein [Sphingobacterium]
MKKWINNLLLFMMFAVMVACESSPRHLGDPPLKPDWKDLFSQQLPLLGHRNWILIVDKAYPAPATKNMLIINTGRKMPEVLDTALRLLDKQTHIRPVFYQDKELGYLDETIAPGLKAYQESLKKLLPNIKLTPLMHEEVFAKMDKAAQLFGVVVLKTESTLPYSSLFIELDCKYWDADRERILRQRLADQVK